MTRDDMNDAAMMATSLLDCKGSMDDGFVGRGAKGLDAQRA